MISTRISRLYVVTFIAIGIVACSTACAATVTVNVSVRTESGDPLENAPLEIVSPTQAGFVTTDANGNASLQIETSPGDDYLTAWLSFGIRHNLTSEDRLLAREKYEEYVDTYFFNDSYVTQIVPGTTEYDVVVTAYDAVSITGRVMNQLVWADDFVLIWPKGGQTHQTPRNQEAFSALARKGEPTELFIWVGSKNDVHSIPLTAQQTSADIALGDLTITPVSGEETVTITLQNGQNVFGPGGVGPLWKEATLIRSDGKVLLCFPVAPDGTMVADLYEPVPVQIPLGTYYVAPGMFGHSVASRLLDRIRAGKIADLDAHGVPKITAPGTLSFDVKEARDAILAASDALR